MNSWQPVPPALSETLSGSDVKQNINATKHMPLLERVVTIEAKTLPALAKLVDQLGETFGQRVTRMENEIELLKQELYG